MSSQAALAARADDTDDVRWALQAAAAQLKSGGQADAIVWVRRAAESAEAAGLVQRGAELRAQARQMAEAMWQLSAGAPPSRPPAESSSSLEIEIDVELEEVPGGSVRPPRVNSNPAPGPSGGPPPLPLRPPPGARGRSDRPSLGGRSDAPGAALPSSPAAARPSGFGASPAPSLSSVAPTVMGFAAPDIERTSYSDVTEQRSNRASAPELEVEELEADALFEAGIPLEVQRSSDVGPRISSLKPTFNDRLSSVDIEPLSVDAVLPDFSGLPRDSQRPVSMPPAPESVRRALALIDDEEINAEDEDQRVTQDFGFLSGEGVNPRTAGASHGRTGLSQRPPSLPPAKPSQTPAPASARSIPPPADAPTSQRPSRLQAELEGQREAWLPPSIPGPSPRSIPPVSSRPAATDPPPSFKTASGLGPESNPTPFGSGSMPPGSMPPGSMPPGSMPPGSVVPGAPSSVPGVPPSINLMQTPMVPAPSSRPGWAPPAEPFMRTPSSRPPEVARLSRRAPPAPGDLLSMDLGELTLEVSDLGPPAQRAASSPPGPLSQSSDSWRALKAAAAPEPEEFPTPTTEVDGLSLTELRGFEDLPPDVQQSLAASATIQPLDADEEVGFFGAAVVTAGSVDILPAISDDSGAVAGPGDVVFTKGTLPDSIALRVVAKLDGTRVAIWEPAVFEAAIAPCPWLHDELRFIADYFIAVCGAALGPLGERLDPALRTAVFKRLEVKALQADEVLLQEGAPIASLFVVGGGRLLVSKGGVDSDELLPGGFVFADKMMMARPAPATVRAGAQGALLLYAPRAVAHELMMSVPPLLEVLAG